MQATTPQIPWRKMKAMRNIAAHEYFGLDLATVWQTATADVPAPLTPTFVRWRAEDACPDGEGLDSDRSVREQGRSRVEPPSCRPPASPPSHGPC